MADGKYPGVPTRERTPESVNMTRNGRRLIERLLTTHRYPTHHLAMTIISILMTETYREGVVVQKIWNNQKHEFIGAVVQPDTG